MTWLVMLVALVASALLQALLPAGPLPGHVKAPLLLGVVVYYALVRRRGIMLAAALTAGLLHDGLSVIPLGYSSCAFCVVGLAVHRYRDAVFARRGLTHLLFGAMAGGGMTLMLAVMMGSSGLIGWDPGLVAIRLVSSAAWGAAAVPVVFRLLEHLEGLVGNPSETAV